MLPKKKRLNLSIKANKEIFLAPCLYTKNFKFYYQSAQKFKATVVIPIKVERKAVRRNRLRRQVYQVIEASDIIQQSVEVLIMAIRQKNNNFNQINQEINKGLQQIKYVLKKQ